MRTNRGLRRNDSMAIRGRSSQLGGILLLSITAAAFAGQPTWGVRLMRPDSLIGWDYGQTPPKGWSIQDGQLRGNGQSTPLLSDYSFGDFELRLAWSVVGQSACLVLLPETPSGQGLRLILGEGKDGCRLLSGNTELAKGAVAPLTEGRMHRAVLRRTGGEVAITIGDQEVCKAAISSDRRFGLGLAATGESVVVADLCVEEPEGEPIFNGKDLTGWWTPGDIAGWAAENGSIVRTTGDRNFLRTRRDFGNFTLSLEYRIAKGGNSGIGIRTPQAGWPSSDGMELQIYDQPPDTPLDEHSQMAIYGNVPPLARSDRSGQWNRAVIKADGRMISAWINGQLVQQINTLHHPELKHRHRKGWIGIQDHHARIEVRNIRVLEAPDDAGLDAWQASPPRTIATVLLDRLMNPERLSVADGIAGHVAFGRVSTDDTGGQVLARLTGPGVLVRIACTGDEGLLAFYFDGEPSPRIECRPADLWKSIPLGVEGVSPAVTCLPFRKSLQIVVNNARSAAYCFDYVTAPADIGVETFTTVGALAPRGWLEAVTTRRNQYGWGVHRHNDPLAHFRSPATSIRPGRAERMLHFDGAGVIHWTKLLADRRVLDNNDLWLEVTVDGQVKPAVAAPARFWFPGLAGQENYPNFVFVDKTGATNMLAMPYGNGITFAVRNCGRRTIDDVALAVSVEQATQQTREAVAGRMRLRGVFQSAEGSLNSLVHCTGRGRWIGLVCQEPGVTPTEIESLTIDGEAVEGRQSTSLDAFWGGAGDFRSPLSGRHGGLCWRYLLLAPVDFQKSLKLKIGSPTPGDRLAMFYVAEELAKAEPQ